MFFWDPKLQLITQAHTHTFPILKQEHNFL